jgi:hypothetical protein
VFVWWLDLFKRQVGSGSARVKVGSGWPVPPYLMCQIEFFDLGRVFWLWFRFFGLGWVLGQKSWPVPSP